MHTNFSLFASIRHVVCKALHLCSFFGNFLAALCPIFPLGELSDDVGIFSPFSSIVRAFVFLVFHS